MGLALPVEFGVEEAIGVVVEVTADVREDDGESEAGDLSFGLLVKRN